MKYMVQMRSGETITDCLGRVQQGRSLVGVFLLLSTLVAAAASGQSSIGQSFDLMDTDSLLWSIEVGSFAYGGPVVGEGRVLVGTNNEVSEISGLDGDHGVLMSVRLSDGDLQWWAAHPKLDRANDYPLQGICSTPTIFGERVYYVSNDAHLLALDSRGFEDGEDDGVADARPELGRADVVWSLDLKSLGVVPHYMSASTPAVDGDRLLVVTGNGSDEQGGVPAPKAPSLLAVDRHDGSVLWSHSEASPHLIDGQWSSPVVATLGERRQVVFAAGDGKIYGVEIDTGRTLWTFDANRGLSEKRRDRGAFVATPAIVGDRVFIGLGRDPEIGFADGALWALSIDDGMTPRVLWQRESPLFGPTISDVQVLGETVFAADLDGYVRAFDAADGEELWRFDALASIWASPVLIDGALWVADIDGDVVRLAADRELRVLSEWFLDRPIHRAPVLTEDVLLVLTAGRLSAFRRTHGDLE